MKRRIQQIVSEIRNLEAGVSRYNQLANRLKLVPASAKRADGISYELRIHREAATPSEFSNLDLKVRPSQWGVDIKISELEKDDVQAWNVLHLCFLLPFLK